MLPRIALAALLFALFLPAVAQEGQHGPPWANVDIASSHPMHFGQSVLQVDFAKGSFDLPQEAILEHIHAAASAIVAYYGRFPVGRARMLIVPVADRDGVFNGTTWPNKGGFDGFTRIHIGQHTTAADLAEDWMTTHELVHLAFPCLDDDQHWMEEGQATYIEPIARVLTGELDARSVWHDMVRDMPKGEPQAGDQGLNNTHTWGRTYWGGALFCLMADVEIRRATQNRKSLRDALRAIVSQDGTIEYDWHLPQALAMGDRATGTNVLTRMYAEWKDKPVPVDLPKLWEELGIRSTAGGGIEFVSTAPLAAIREAIAGEPTHAKRAATSGGSD